MREVRQMGRGEGEGGGRRGERGGRGEGGEVREVGGWRRKVEVIEVGEVVRPEQ